MCVGSCELTGARVLAKLGMDGARGLRKGDPLNLPLSPGHLGTARNATGLYVARLAIESKCVRAELGAELHLLGCLLQLVGDKAARTVLIRALGTMASTRSH